MRALHGDSTEKKQALFSFSLNESNKPCVENNNNIISSPRLTIGLLLKSISKDMVIPDSQIATVYSDYQVGYLCMTESTMTTLQHTLNTQNSRLKRRNSSHMSNH